ncbi:MAG: DUF4381 family protein [Ferruginibacter sp.]
MKFSGNITGMIVMCMLGFLYILPAAGQQPLQTQVDKNKILIGEQIHYTMRLNLGSAGYNVDFGVPDSIPHFEILDRRQYDTVEKSGKFVLIQKMVLTSFDSGLWTLPRFIVTVSSSNKKAQQFSNDSLQVMVGYSPSDTTGLYDIKPPLQVHIPDYTIWYIIAAIITLLILAYIIYRYFKTRKKKEKPVFIPSLKPYDEAMKALASLKSLDLNTYEGNKAYYSGLSEIFKKYYSNKERTSMLTLTTSDVLIELKGKGKTAGVASAVAEILRLSDAVKFAKYTPPVSEAGAAWNQTKAIIDAMEKNYSET